jgi:hypothetical protein
MFELILMQSKSNLEQKDRTKIKFTLQRIVWNQHRNPPEKHDLPIPHETDDVINQKITQSSHLKQANCQHIFIFNYVHKKTTFHKHI